MTSHFQPRVRGAELPIISALLLRFGTLPQQLRYIRYYTSVASFYVENFGCRATQSDGAALDRQFAARGLDRAESPNDAQIVVLNTCTVTAAADQDARAAIRRIYRENPGCQIVITGCYAQRAPQEVAALPGVAAVIGNSHKHQLADLALGPSTANQDLVSGEAFRPADKVQVERATSEAEDVVAASTGVKADNTPAPTGCFSQKLSVPGLADDRSAGFVPLQSLAQGSTINDGFPTTHDPRTTTIHVSDIFAHTELLAAPVFDASNERTRPNLKVQDGCDNRCSFCVIPYVRGHSRSLRLTSVITEVQRLVEAGYREIVISGINLGRWGRDLSVVSRRLSMLDDGLVRNKSRVSDRPLPRAESLEDLIRAILDQTNVEKLRISSVEPMDWTDELIGLVAGSPRIAKHAHVPMQSGSDRVLRAMHRKYRPWHYREKIAKIRAAMPTAAIGADVMVGFPGETDADFEETRCLIEELPFTYLHVFTYSARPGTPAASLPNQISVRLARERNRILRELASEKKLAFMKSFIGKTIHAITLNVFGGEYTEALTDNYLKLRIRGKLPANHWIEAIVDEVGGGALVGHCVRADGSAGVASRDRYF
jgi:threonylcarbamoyladenosine tRNA methylthiotransferase MtaB